MNLIDKIEGFINKLTAKFGDKKMHAICSFLITFIFGLFNLLSGILIGCIAGLAKEVYDQFKYVKHGEGVGFDKSDLVYDVIGIAIAVVLLLII